MKTSTKKYFLKIYKLILEEELFIFIDSFRCNKWRKRYFKDNERIEKIFFDELVSYFDCVKYQKKVLNFLYWNNNNLSSDCIDITIDLVDKYGKENFEHIDYMLGMLKTACCMDAEYKFYVPRKKFEYLNAENYDKFIRIASGFDILSIKDFLMVHDVLNFKEFDEIYNNSKIIPIDCVDTTFIGEFEGGWKLPEVYNDKTALVCLHELVHQSLQLNIPYIENDDIVYGEELPIFYEMLYKKCNGLIKCDTNYNEISDELLKSYHSEPFMEQVKKLERLI